MDLLNLCLTLIFFQYHSKHYKHLHGTAMGSLVSVVVTEIVMQNIAEQALASYKQAIPLWLRYVDDTLYTKTRLTIFTNISTDKTPTFSLPRRSRIMVTKDSFSWLLSHPWQHRLQTTVYWKPAQTDRLLDEASYNPTSHKATTIRTLMTWALLVCDSHDSLADKHKCLDNVFRKNSYNCDFVTCNTVQNLTQQTLIWHLPLQWLYPISKEPLK